MLLGRKCKLSIFNFFLCLLILDSLVFVHNNSLEWIFMIWFSLNFTYYYIYRLLAITRKKKEDESYWKFLLRF